MLNHEAELGIFIWNSGGLSEDDMALGMPDEAEAKNLKHHTAKCGMRFRLFSRKMGEQGKQLNQIQLILILVGGYLIAVSEPAKNVILGVLKHIGV
jgi:hypothetical protein